MTAWPIKTSENYAYRKHDLPLTYLIRFIIHPHSIAVNYSGRPQNRFYTLSSTKYFSAMNIIFINTVMQRVHGSAFGVIRLWLVFDIFILYFILYVYQEHYLCHGEYLILEQIYAKIAIMIKLYLYIYI